MEDGADTPQHEYNGQIVREKSGRVGGHCQRDAHCGNPCHRGGGTLGEALGDVAAEKSADSRQQRERRTKLECGVAHAQAMLAL